MHTGENEQGLRKILDLTRMMSIVILLLHYYYACYAVFRQWGLTAALSDRLLLNIYHTGLFTSFFKVKGIALVLLLISLLGARGQKKETLSLKTTGAYLAAGFMLYVGSYGIYLLKGNLDVMAVAYMGVTTTGYILMLTGGTLLSRIIHRKLSPDVFNTRNETFPQEERLLTNDYSINLPARYNLKGQVRKSWINIINPFRGLLVMGRREAASPILLSSTSSASTSKKDSACSSMTLSLTTFPALPITSF